MINDPDEDDIDGTFISPLSFQSRTRAITWDVVKEETSKDQSMQNLMSLINTVFPQQKNELPAELMPYWSIRDNLYVIDDVILMKDKIVLPPTLRGGVVDEYIPDMTRYDQDRHPTYSAQ